MNTIFLISLKFFQLITRFWYKEKWIMSIYTRCIILPPEINSEKLFQSILIFTLLSREISSVQIKESDNRYLYYGTNLKISELAGPNGG